MTQLGSAVQWRAVVVAHGFSWRKRALVRDFTGRADVRFISRGADVPAVRETGGNLASFNVTSWNGLAVPAKTPKDVIARLNREVNAALNQPDVKKRLAELNLDAHGGTPEQAAEFLTSDIKRWAEVIARAKIEKQ